LFGDNVTDVRMRRETVRFDLCATPLDFREFWKTNYGPTIATYRFNAEDPERVKRLDRDFLAFLEETNLSAEAGATAYDAEYLLVTATKS